MMSADDTDDANTPSTMKLVDSHCHLHFEDFDPSREDTMERAQQAGVAHMLLVSIHLRDANERVLPLARQYPERFSASVGVHPNYCEQEPWDGETIERYARDASVVAIGETGLDFYRDHADIAVQERCFATQIELAKKLTKPLIIHTREAMQRTYEVLKSEGAADIGGVMHCFTGTWEEAKRFIDLNFMISLSGIVTFKNAQVLQDVARKLPEDRLLIETDCPYLAPVPHRGKRNEPGFVADVARAVAALRQTRVEHIAAWSTRNFSALFLANRVDVAAELSKT